MLRLPSERLPAFVQDDLIAPIDDYLTEADILPNTLDAVRLKDGKAFAGLMDKQLTNPEVCAVSIAMPDHLHRDVTIACADTGSSSAKGRWPSLFGSSGSGIASLRVLIL